MLKSAPTQDCVLIAGAGPVGLTLALCLAEAGVYVKLFEAAPDIVEDLRASTFHPPTLDMLDQFCITDELIAQGLICPHWQIRLHPSGDRAVFDLAAIAKHTKHPYRLQCEQWKLSRAVLSRITHHKNVELHFSSVVVSAEQDASGVTLVVEQGGERGGEQRTVTGRYAVGCDGARSVIRHAMGVEFSGETYPETTILATTRFPFDEHLPGLSNVSYCWKAAGGNFSLLRLPGVWRTSIYPAEDRSIEESLSPAAIAQSLAEIVPAAGNTEVLEVRPYRVHQRIATQYRQGRLLLAGDAAHLNSPAGGMGMNGGVHDAFNLADKLARVWRGETESLLDLYERQRRPIAQQQIIAQADTNRVRMRERDPAKRQEILDGFKAVIAEPEKLRVHLLKTSMITGLKQAAAIS
ncbi:MAG: FAD-dependent monooxygenase [Aeromicrobium sp.]|nr:FAD-dependent monooxygenase [Burkholderiales bacterium]